MPLSPGTGLGRYAIVSPLGAGGMGEVYRAKDSSLDREVAIKVLPPTMTAEADRLTRFEREAKALAALNHPNIATLYGMERAELDGQDQPFLVMELVEGPTLADRIAQGAMPWQEAAQIFLEIATAIEAAHESGIVHRDLKPANVKLGRAGATGEARVKVLDFGLAKAMEPQAASGSAPSLDESPTLTLAATMRGEVLGTAGYMAPEQARGAAVDKRADVWAFGVCLFEALSGHGTFGGDTISDRLAAVLKDEPDWQTLPSDLPPRMLSLLRRCLEKSARTRLRDIGEARIVLSELVADPDAAAAAPALAAIGVGETGSPGSRPRWLVPVVAAIAFGLGALLTGALIRGGDAPPSLGAEPRRAVRFEVGAADGGELGVVGGMGLSPDGRWLVYAGGTERGAGLILIGDRPPLRVRALDEFDGATRTLAGTEGAITPFFSPDSQWIGYLRGTGGQRSAYKVHVESGSITRLTVGPHIGFGADWAEDGRIALGAARGPLMWITPDSDQLGEPFTTLDEQAGELAHLNPETLPGGRGVIFTSLVAGAALPVVKAWDARSETTKTLLAQGGEARYLRSGHLLYGRGGNLMTIGFDLESLEIVGDPKIVLEGVRTLSLGNASFDVAHNGTLVYLLGEVIPTDEMRLVWMTPDGRSEVEVARGDVAFPTISEDGRRWLARTGGTEITLFEKGAPAPLRFPTSFPVKSLPFFLPGGREVAFGIESDGKSGLYRLDLGSGAGTLQEFAPGVRRTPIGFDPESGEAIALIPRRVDGAFDLDVGIGDLDGQQPHRLLVSSPWREGGAKLSKDGKLLAWEQLPDTGGTYGGKLMVADFPDMSRRIAVGEKTASNAYAWDADGRLFYADSEEMLIATIEREPELRVTKVEVAFGDLFQYWVNRSFGIGPDGRLLIIRGSTVEVQVRPSERFRVVLGWAREEGLDR